LKLKLEYMEYLRVTLQGSYHVLTKPFNNPPPPKLVPFAECIANKTADAISDIPRAGDVADSFRQRVEIQFYLSSFLGKMQPILCHKSEDDRAFMCIKRAPDNSIFCYMAVVPDAHAMSEI
jgi:hypothetical protein